MQASHWVPRMVAPSRWAARAGRTDNYRFVGAGRMWAGAGESAVFAPRKVMGKLWEKFCGKLWEVMEGMKSRSISRVLSRATIHLGRLSPNRLLRPTRVRRGPRQMDPYLALLRAGMPSRALLPAPAVRSYRTLSPLADLKRPAVCSLLHLPRGSRPPGVTWHPVLWSPDFPHALLLRTRGCLTDSPPSIVLSFAPQGDGLFVQRAARCSRDSGGEFGRLGGREFICEGVQDGLRITRRRCYADV